MQTLWTTLKNKLKGARAVAILGIGSELRGDDALGIFIGRSLQAHISKNKIKKVKVFLGHTAPENLTSEIRRFNPSHLLIIDAVDFKARPGQAAIINTGTEAGASFSTHKMPIEIFKDYLYKSIGCSTLLLGIQPGSMNTFGLQERAAEISAELTGIF